MQDSQWAGLLAIAAGAFAITATVCDWDWFMNSRKAKAWVKRIGRDKARLMYGAIGGFVCLFGLGLVIIAPGDADAPALTAESAAPAPQQDRPPARSAQPPRAPQAGAASSTSTTTPSPHGSTPRSAPAPAATSNPTSTSTTSGTTPRTRSSEPAQPSSSARTTSPREPAASPTTTDGATPSTTERPMSLVEAGEGIDLLPLIDPQRDRLEGRWSKQNGALISPKARPANLQIPVDVPASYRLLAVVEMVDGNELFSLGLVVGGHGVAAVLSGPGGNNCGLQKLDGKIARRNETRYEGAALQPGVNEVVCTVDGNHILVECNGETIIDWSGDPARLSYGSASNPTDRLLVGSWNTSCRISQLMLAPLADR